MRLSLVQVVTNQILDRIANNEFAPGSVLPAEDEFARLMEASRPTCREAVKVLCTQGVLRSVQGSGTFVNPLREWISMDAILRMQDANLHKAMSDLIDVRTLIEVGAAEIFAPLCAPEDLALMGADLDDMRDSHASGDVEGFVAADMAFHNRILDGCDNPFIPATLRPIASTLHQARTQTSSVSAIRENAIVEHGRILEALRDNVPGAAGAAMRSHLEQTRRDALHHLNHKPPTT